MVINLSLLEQLNDAQKEAVTTIEGPVLIFAGAGSGKTRALTYRIAYMVEEKGIAPSRILAVTFTNRAANEMKGRIEKLIGAQARQLWAGTFHSICARLLRRYGEKIGIPPNFVIYDDTDQQALIKRALSLADVDAEAYPPTRVLNAISNGKNELLDVQDYRRTRKGPFEEIIARVYGHYQRALRANNALDFDDLLMQAVALLKSRPEVLSELQDRFAYVLVDEYQDINYAQYELVRLLSERTQNICVVGDDDQSIYGWRGANVGLILNFRDDFPKAKIIKLEQNYRSTQRILDCAYAVIRHNEERAEKRLWTDKAGGDKLVVYEAVNEEEEAAWVVRLIARQVRSSGMRYGDYAVLYRTNAMSRVLETGLRELGVPYEIVGGMSFYDRAEVKDIAAYLKVLFNPADEVALRRIINRPTRGIGDVTVKRLTQVADASNVTLYEACRLMADDEDLRKAQREAVLDFHEMMERLAEDAQTMGVSDLVERVLQRSGYMKALAASGNAEDADKKDNLGELLTDAVKYERSAAEPTLGDFLERLALLSDIDMAEELDSTVSLMTLHSAKGLEFPVVFVVGLEEGVFPHERSMHDEFELAEERRLCYVGLTRAQRMVFLSHCRGRTIFGMPTRMKPSRFLKDLPPELVERKGQLNDPLTPRMFGDEEAALQQQATSEYDLDIRVVLANARQRVEAEETDHTRAGKKAKAPEAKKKAPRQPQKATRKRAGSRKFSDGAKIEHEDFGKGVVVSVSKGEGEQILTVAFSAGGLKKLQADHPKLKLRR